MTTLDKENILRKIEVGTGIIKKVSQNVYAMGIDFSEPTGEEYFKTSQKYDDLQESNTDDES